MKRLLLIFNAIEDQKVYGFGMALLGSSCGEDGLKEKN